MTAVALGLLSPAALLGDDEVDLFQVNEEAHNGEPLPEQRPATDAS